MKLYTIFTSDGGYWVSPESPFITTSQLYAEAVLKLYLQHNKSGWEFGSDDAKVVELKIDQNVFDGTDDRVK